MVSVLLMAHLLVLAFIYLHFLSLVLGECDAWIAL